MSTNFNYGSSWPGTIVFNNELITTVSSGTTLSASYYPTMSASNYTHSWASYPAATSLYENKAKEIVDKVLEELSHINQKYRLWDANFTGCDVLAAKMIHSQLPKNSGEFAGSTPIKGATPRRRVFLLVKFQGDATKEYIIDPFAAQYGGPPIQPAAETLPEHWIADFRYKTSAALVKRLAKEGCPSKELFLKDAIALSTRYNISSISPTQMDAHVINPDDVEGHKFLENFSKEVGFKTTLAQLLLDKDPIVAEKAKVIAQLILQR